MHAWRQAWIEIQLSYTWVKKALEGAGLVREERKQEVHRRRLERRPLPGMLLHIDGSRHQWFQDDRWYDLLVLLDDATSRIYCAQLVEEELSAGQVDILEYPLKIGMITHNLCDTSSAKSADHILRFR